MVININLIGFIQRLIYIDRDTFYSWNIIFFEGNPCGKNNGGCEQQCVGNEGFATCRCHTGTLNSDGKNCDQGGLYQSIFY